MSRKALKRLLTIDTSDTTMYAASKPRSVKRRRVTKRKSIVGNRLAITGRANSCIVPLTVDYDINLSVDPAYGFSFSTTSLYVNAGSYSVIPGASELAAVFDLMRIQKIEMTMLPGCDDLSYAANGISTGNRNIPWMYHAFDPNDDTAPSLAVMHEMASTRVDLFNRAIKRTFYPRLKTTGKITDVGQNAKNLFVQSGSDDALWYGIKIRADLLAALTYCDARLSFKVFFECRQSK